MRGGLTREDLRTRRRPSLFLRQQAAEVEKTMDIAVLLADDHGPTREGMRVLLHSQPDIRVVAEACTYAQAVHAAQRLHPHVAVIDIALRGGGLEAARRISLIEPGTAIIILSMHANRAYVLDALRMGARGYLLKEMIGAQMIEAVRAVHGGLRYLSPGADMPADE